MFDLSKYFDSAPDPDGEDSEPPKPADDESTADDSESGKTQTAPSLLQSFFGSSSEPAETEGQEPESLLTSVMSVFGSKGASSDDAGTDGKKGGGQDVSALSMFGEDDEDEEEEDHPHSPPQASQPVADDPAASQMAPADESVFDSLLSFISPSVTNKSNGNERTEDVKENGSSPLHDFSESAASGDDVGGAVNPETLELRAELLIAEGEELVTVLKRPESMSHFQDLLNQWLEQRNMGEILDIGTELSAGLGVKPVTSPDVVQSTVQGLLDRAKSSDDLDSLIAVMKLIAQDVATGRPVSDATVNKAAQSGKELVSTLSTSNEAQTLARIVQESTELVSKDENLQKLRRAKEKLKTHHLVQQQLPRLERIFDDVMATDEYKALRSVAPELLGRLAPAEPGSGNVPLLARNSQNEIQALLQGVQVLLQRVQKSAEFQAIVSDAQRLLEAERNSPESQAIIVEVEKTLEDACVRRTLANFFHHSKTWARDVKNVVVPYVQEVLLALDIPDVSGVEETAVGSFHYHISHLVFSGLNIPPSGVIIEFGEPSSVSMCVGGLHDFIPHPNLIVRLPGHSTGVSARLRPFNWSFKRITAPFVEDEGVATASVTGGRCSIVFTVEIDEDDENRVPFIDVETVSIQMADLELSFETGILYNVLSTLFSQEIRQACEEEITAKLASSANIVADLINDVADDHWPGLLTGIRRTAHNFLQNEASSESK